MHGAFASVTQVLALLAGLLVVRALDVPGYAAYAICTSIVSAASMIATSGTASELMASAGSTSRTGMSMGRLFRAAQSVRRLMVAVISVPLAALLLVLLLANAVPLGEAALLTLGTLVVVINTVSIDFSKIALRIQSDLAPLRWLPLALTALRVLLLTSLALLSITWVPAYLAVTVVLAALEAVLFHRRAKRHVNFRESITPSDRVPFVLAFRRTILSTVLLVAGEQLVTIMLTIAGNTAGIAVVAALSRFSMVYLVINSVAGDLVAPWVARLPPNRTVLLRAAGAVSTFYLGVAALIVLACMFFGEQLLWILGPDYSGLEVELLIVMGGTGLLMAGRGLGLVNYARGWNKHSWVYAPLLAAWFVLGVTTIDLSTLIGAVLFSSTLSFVSVAQNIIRFATGLAAKDGTAG